MSDYVILKGKKDRLVIQLDKNIDFTSLKNRFTQKIKEAEGFIGKSKIAIEFSGRELSEVEENILVGVINKETEIDIAFIFSEESPLTELPFRKLKDVTEEGNTKFHRGTLRSGNMLDFDGNIVVLGDVNPGASIKAKGNVLVLGYLNGTVHIVDEKPHDAFIGAFSLNPIQIKIGQVIAKNPNANILDVNKVKKTVDFEVAYLKNGSIFIDKFNKKTLENMIEI